MPIDKKIFEQIENKERADNKKLLDFMQPDKAYSTAEIRDFLKLTHSATILRLRRLLDKGILRRKYIGRTFYWIKNEEAFEADLG